MRDHFVYVIDTLDGEKEGEKNYPSVEDEPMRHLDGENKKKKKQKKKKKKLSFSRGCTDEIQHFLQDITTCNAPFLTKHGTECGTGRDV